MASKNISQEVYIERRKKLISSIEQKEKLIASEQQKVAKLKEDLTKNDEEYILSLYRTSGQSAVEFVQSISNQNINVKEDKTISTTSSPVSSNSGQSDNHNMSNSYNSNELNGNTNSLYFNNTKFKESN